ncbi:hypothetical protein B0H16DRAFT_1858088 [Mycena metata]|uniref:Uncharacterized protein n=1 Tax=Mycena metata TaxID=1033252 RepID=A0AAD7IKU1_9AGAR|nr:hypothetical protein B0H16DRAFT_1858088 [Mycena metata]
MSSESTTGECTAHDKHSDQECDCTSYTEAADIPGYCGDCYHTRQDHLHSRPGAVKKTSAVQALLAGLGGKSKAGPSKARGAGSSLGGLLATAGSSKKKSALLNAANREANQGMRPVRDEEKKSKKAKGKEPASRKREADTFKVASAQVIPSGTVFKRIQGAGSKNKKLRQVPEEYETVPDRVEMQTAQLNGLAVVKSQGIEFSRDADHEEVVALPLPFDYFGRLQREADDDELLWYLATAVRGRLTLVPSRRPDGSAIEINKGHATASWRNSHIFIVSRDPIPGDLLQEWAAANMESSLSVDTSEDELDTPMSDAEVEHDSPEKIPRKNKRRLFSHSDDEDDEKPAKKKKASSKWSREPEILNDKIADEISGSSELIDLTSDEVRTSRSTPDFLRPVPKSPPARAASPGRPEEFDDSSLGNPYDKNATFKF